MLKPVRRLFVGVCMVVGTATTAAAQGTWVEIKSPRFTVVSNAGEGRAREIAWQFEQIRAAILAGWPWARATLDRPMIVIAAKDEATMKTLVPQLRGESATTTTSVGQTAPDAHYIALRSDVRAADNAENNPYYSAYWIFSAIVLTTGGEHELPLWYWNGLAAVLGNTIVRPSEMRFGLPVPALVRLVRDESRLRLSDFLTQDSSSSYYSDPRTRSRFDAQAWAFMHYLLYEASVDQADRVERLNRLVLEGRPSLESVKEAFGDLDALETAYLKHMQKPLVRYAVAKIETKIDAKAFTARTLSPAESAASRAGLLAAFNQPVEARALLAESRKTDAASPRSYEVEGMLLDRENKRAEAQSAFEKAEQLKSENFYTYFRLAILTWPDKGVSPDTEKRLRRAAALNEAHASTQAMLADALLSAKRAEDALAPAKRAVTLDPRGVQPRLSLARVLWALMNRAEARGVARSALLAARTDEERQQAKQLIDFFDKAQ
jgi:tetratricopeptide (TPR) repeat protein